MKVLLVDDHPLFREGLALLLAPMLAGASVRMAGSAEEAMAVLAAEGDIDLVLMDLAMPGTPGLACIEQIHTRWSRTTVVALSSADDRDTVLRALDAGAMGFIPKSSDSQVLDAALRQAIAGNIYLPPSALLDSTRSWAQPRAGSAAAPAKTAQSLGLTKRQCDVLRLMLQGKPRKLIERELKLSEGTVKQHTSAVLRALGATTRTQAVVNAFAMRLQLPEPADPADAQPGAGGHARSKAETATSSSEGDAGL